MGIWGFITLIIQYLNQINFGIAHSVTAITSIYKEKKLYVEKVIGTSLTLLIGLSLIVVLLFMANELFNFNLGAKYNFSKYAPVIAAIGILAYFNTLMSNIFRVYGRLIEIAINQSAFPILMFVSILLFKNEKLLWALIGANFLAFLLSFIIYIKRSPINLKPIFKWRLIKTIQIKGIYLFIYSASFYFIIISTKFISAYFRLKLVILLLPLHYYVVLFYCNLFLSSFFPKLTILSTATTEKVKSVLELIMDIYITTSHLLIHFAILLFPLFVLFFPQYKQSSDAFIMIALTTVLYTNSFGYSCLLIAKGFEKKLGQISFFTLLINIILVYVLIKAFHMPTICICCNLIAYFI